jgi:hypothetical protein
VCNFGPKQALEAFKNASPDWFSGTCEPESPRFPPDFHSISAQNGLKTGLFVLPPGVDLPQWLAFIFFRVPNNFPMATVCRADATVLLQLGQLFVTDLRASLVNRAISSVVAEGSSLIIATFFRELSRELFKELLAIAVVLQERGDLRVSREVDIPHGVKAPEEGPGFSP